jgi:hypothetical protein
MGSLLPLIVVLALWVLVGGGPAAWLAAERGRSVGNGLVAGMFFGPLAVVAIGLAPLGATGRFGQCPECLEGVRKFATRCPHCGADLIEEEAAS